MFITFANMQLFKPWMLISNYDSALSAQKNHVVNFDPRANLTRTYKEEKIHVVRFDY